MNKSDDNDVWGHLLRKCERERIVGASMPRFYFETREGGDFTPDDDGTEFPDLSAAEHEAVVAVAEMARDLLPKGLTRDITIEVHDEHRQRLLAITVEMKIDRVDPSPALPNT